MYRLLAFLILSSISTCLFSIQNKFNYLTPEDGLSQGNIASIYQDSKGFMWFGTFNGLNRYDGYSIKVFNTDINDSLSLGYGHVKFINEDNEHKLWLGTYGNGISVFFPEEEVFRNIVKFKVGSKNIQLRNLAGLLADENGEIWVLDEQQGLFLFDADLKVKKAYLPDAKNPNGLTTLYYQALGMDASGDLWIGGGNGTLIRFDTKKELFKTYVFETRTAASDDGIKCMYVDKSGIIWIGTVSQGLYQFDPGAETFKNIRKGDTPYDLGSNTVLCFNEDWNGNLLIGTDGGGIGVMDRQTGVIQRIVYEMSNPESLSTNAIYTLFIDRTETLWIGTYAGGVNYSGRYRNKFFTYRPEPLNPNSLSYKNAKCFLEDSDGDFWIGTDGGGLNKFDLTTGKFEHFRANPANRQWLQTDVIINLMQDNEGDIYIGSYSGGLTIFKKKERIFKRYMPDANNPNSIAGIHPWCFLQDSYGDIWVGMLAVGLEKFDKKTETFKHYVSVITDPTTLNSPNIKVMLEDKARRLWIGTEGGGLHLYNREKENFTRYFSDPTIPGSITNNDVRAIFEDSKGRLWVGTGDGLNLMDRDKGTFAVISVKDGLAGNIINDILEDNDSNLWISTNKGISKYNPDKKTFRNYDITDGLQGNEFNYTAAIKSRDGYFFFGGKNGFNVFRPEDIVDNPNLPQIALTDFQIANKPVITLLYKNKKYSVAYIKDIVLTYKENIIGFEFSALDFSNPVKNKYKYKLEGFDKEWTEVTSSKRSVSYTNLDAGKYVFRVIASNSDEKWNNEGLSINLTITPPFWKRTWFIILVSLLVIYVIYQYVRNKQKANVHEKTILEEKISAGLAELEKEKKAVEQKDRILQEKIKNEEQQKWHNNGLTQLSEVISQHKDNLYELSQTIISEMVKHLNVEQGALYLVKSENINESYLEIMGSYAADISRIKGRRFNLDEGNIGACFNTKKIIRINNLPEGYAYCQSGLGNASLRNMIGVPLKLNDSVIGVVELLSFQEIPDYKVHFIEKAGETLTSILTALNANEQSKKLIETQRIQAEESAAKEEELRQNLEELQATQDEVSRQAAEMEKQTSYFVKKEKEYQKRIEELETKKGKQK